MSIFEMTETDSIVENWIPEPPKRKRIDGQVIMLFFYSAIVMFALVLVICRNFETPEQIVAEEKLALEGKRANEMALRFNRQSVPEVYEEDAEEEVESFDNPAVEWTVQGEENQPEVKDDVLIVEKGDHFIGILQRLGMEYNEASQAADSLKKAGFDVRSLKAGQKINITKTVDVPFGELLSVDKIVIEPSVGVKYTVTRNEDEKYVAEAEQQEMINENKIVSGIVNRSTLSAAMSNAGIPQNVVSNFTNIFRYKVNFRSDIHAGDGFKILYDRKMTADGRVFKNGNILYAELTLGKKKVALYRYKDAAGNVDYYDENGMALKRGLVRKPLEFSSARVSSRFGWRLHPILKQRILHSGVDYAAPTGSRIYASGDGVVQRAQWAGGYGRYVVIKHNAEYSTGYAHMSGFARGIKPGMRVKQGQVIGYVGSTGRSTGPHLHFEVIKNGKKVDPLKIQAATGANLTGKELQRFKVEIKKILAMANGENKLADAHNLIDKE